MHEKAIKGEKDPKSKNARNIRDRPIYIERVLQGEQTDAIEQPNREEKQNAKEDKGRSWTKPGDQATRYLLYHKICHQIQDRYQKLIAVINEGNQGLMKLID